MDKAPSQGYFLNIRKKLRNLNHSPVRKIIPLECATRELLDMSFGMKRQATASTISLTRSPFPQIHRRVVHQFLNFCMKAIASSNEMPCPGVQLNSSINGAAHQFSQHPQLKPICLVLPISSWSVSAVKIILPSQWAASVAARCSRFDLPHSTLGLVSCYGCSLS